MVAILMLASCGSDDEQPQKENQPQNEREVLYFDGVENGHTYVDLGLPSGLKWATMNVGAISPKGFGNYYAWGETVPQSNNRYSWDSYKWCNGSYNSMTKYCAPYDIVGNNTTLNLEDDAASVNWGGSWRMPTYIEQKELINNCYWVWTDRYNGTSMAGYIVYKVKLSSDKGQVVTFWNTPSNSYSLYDSHIFLPAAGFCFEGSSAYECSLGFYWSSSLSESQNCYAWILRFGSIDRDDYYNYSRCRGYSVRAVCDK